MTGKPQRPLQSGGGRTATSAGEGGHFFFFMAVACLLIVLIGFARTFYLRLFFDVPPISFTVFLHGVVLTGWFALFVAQPWLIRMGRIGTHRMLGMVGAVLGLALVVVTLMTTVGLAQKQLAAGKTIDMVSNLAWMNFAFLLAFTVLSGSAIVLRRRPDAHKRLMLLASVSIVFPALVRFPSVLTLGDASVFSFAVIGLMFAALVVYDLSSRKRPHPVSFLGPAFIVSVIGAGKFVIGATAFGREIVRALG